MWQNKYAQSHNNGLYDSLMNFMKNKLDGQESIYCWAMLAEVSQLIFFNSKENAELKVWWVTGGILSNIIKL